MCDLKKIVVFLLLLISQYNYAQLGFCNGSKGDSVFTEDFGNGTNYGPALPTGTTNYTFVTGAPNDGMYTLFYRTNLYSTWHNSLDHTPDATNGPNGKALIVNADASTSGDFYKRTVSGLCINTTFEFSAWLMNIYNPGSNYCGASEIPINVRFEIWDTTETVLLGSGNTGNIIGTAAPLWQQFALVFTTGSQTSVVLKMKNNGLGGCGNDLAIDDIEFRSCGDLTTITSPSAVANSYATCQNPVSIQLQANTSGSPVHFYQWQQSLDGITWTDIVGATNANYVTPNLTTQTFFRTKVAQDAINLSNSFCSTLSNIFTVSFLAVPANCISNGDVVICSNTAIPALSVVFNSTSGVNWYSAPTGGVLLQSNSTSYTPIAAGIFYAEAYNLTTNCKSNSRTPVSLTIVPLPTASISGSTSICSGNSTTFSINGTPNAIVTYTINGGSNQTIALNSSGVATLTTPTLTSTTTYTLVSCTSSVLSSCSVSLNSSAIITIDTVPTAIISGTTTICSGNSSIVDFNGTPNAIVTYTVNGGSNQTITLNSSGVASVITPILTSNTTYVLVSAIPSLTSACMATLNGSVIITVISKPTVSISGTTSICSGNSGTISFNGTPNALITYTVNGGANHTITLNSIGVASIVTPILTSNTIYTLVSCASSILSGCVTMYSSSVLITVNPKPTVTITGTSTICYGTSTVVTFNGTPNAVVTYTINNGANQIVTLVGGQATITTPNLTSSTVYTLVNIVSNGANACSQTLSQSFTIAIAPLPTATLTASPTSVCSGQTSTLNFSGTPNAIITYTINGTTNASITLDSSGLASVTTSNLTSNTLFQLTNASVSGAINCSQSLSTSVLISINSTPIASYNGVLHYCSNDFINIGLTSNIPGTTYSWTVIQNGTSGAISGSGNLINQQLNTTGAIDGTVIYAVTPFYNGCQGNPIQIPVTIHPLPNPTISDGVICLNTSNSSSQPYTLTTNLSATVYSFSWFFQGNPIPNAFGNVYNANQIGTYSVIATNILTGCISNLVTATVTAIAQGESLIVNHSEDISDVPMITVTVVGGIGPFLYQMDNSNFQTSNVFYPNTLGLHTITVVDNNSCTNLFATVTLLNYPHYFTPNNDGINDTWNINGLVEDSRILIFDRYGKLIKQISSSGSGWDGTYNGQLLIADDYWFVLDYVDNQVKKTFKAHFALKR